MKTKYHENNIEQIYYPVGAHMDTNKPKIIAMIKEFKKIREFKRADLNLICRGSSGAIIAAIFAMQLKNNCRIVHIKKEGEQSHSAQTSLLPNGKNIIVDDFIVTGKTLNAIYKSLTNIEKTPIVIDCICITGSTHTLDFEPRHWIHSEF